MRCPNHGLSAPVPLGAFSEFRDLQSSSSDLSHGVQSPDAVKQKAPKRGLQLLSGSVEQLLEKGFLALGMAVLMAVTVWLSVARIVALRF